MLRLIMTKEKYAAGKITEYAKNDFKPIEFTVDMKNYKGNYKSKLVAASDTGALRKWLINKRKAEEKYWKQMKNIRFGSSYNVA